MTAAPPWTLGELVVPVTLPREPVVTIAQRAAEPVEVGWPRVRVIQDRPPPAPRVIALGGPPQGPFRLPLAPVAINLLAHPLPRARTGPQAADLRKRS